MRWLVCGLCVWGALPTNVPAQEIKTLLEALGQPAPSTPQTPVRSIEEELVWARAEVAAAQEVLSPESEKAIAAQLSAAGLPADRLEDFRAASRDIQRNLQGAITLLTGLSDLEREAAETPVVEPPTTEEEAVVLREQKRRAELAARAASGDGELFSRLAAQSTAVTAGIEREIRQIREELSTARGDEARNRAESRLALAEWQKRAAESAAFFNRWRLYQQELVAKRSTARVQALAQVLQRTGFDRQIAGDRATRQLALLETEVADVEARIKSMETTLHGAMEARTKLEQSPSPDPRRLATARQLVEAAQSLLLTLQGDLTLLQIERSHWQAVSRLSGNLDETELRKALTQSDEAQRTLTDSRPLLERRLQEARDTLTAAEQDATEAGAPAPLQASREKVVALARDRVEELSDLLARASQMVTLREEFRTEVEANLRHQTLAERARRSWAHFVSTVEAIWAFEPYPFGNSRVTVGKVVMAVTGVLLALLRAGLASRASSRAARRSFKFDEGQTAMVQKIVFFPFAALLVFTVLNWLSIPLTAFAFLGGALAIGIGFGAQTLMNNFISGLILLTERQIKIGDIIEVDGNTGRITHLGSRCSRLRKFNGVEVLIPNSSFLEKDVVNWTLNDPQHRFDFAVGAAYGSPVEKVIAILQEAVNAEPEVLRDPAPGVFFEEFADSALVFRVYFWVEVGGLTDSRLVGSNIRRRIAEDFAKAGVEMPFPQRDLHVRAPLTVRLEK